MQIPARPTCEGENSSGLAPATAERFSPRSPYQKLGGSLAGGRARRRRPQSGGLFRLPSRHIHLTSWSSDGQWIAAQDNPVTNPRDCWLIPVNGKDPIAVANSGAAESAPQFSPDGKWIAYSSDETGRSEIYVASFPGLQSRWQVSSDGGTAPQWDPEGHSLYYLQNGYLVAHEVNTVGTFRRGRSKQLFKTSADYFQAIKGGRFVMQEVNTQPPDAPIQLIVNWFPEIMAKFNK